MTIAWWNSPETVGLAREGAHAVVHRESMDLSGEWRFQLLRNPTEQYTESWERVQVPGVWTMTSLDDRAIYLNTRMPFTTPPPYTPVVNPTGVYQREFTVPESWASDQVLLRVEGTEGAYRVDVNGHPVGISKGSRLPAEFDLTGLTRPDGNQLTMTIPRWSDASFLEDQDQWWHAGLSRGISLVRVPRLHLADVHLDADFDPESGCASLTAEVVVRDGRAPISGGLTVRVSVGGASERASVSAPDSVDAKHRAVQTAASIPAGVDPFTLFYLANAGAPLPEAVQPIISQARNAMYPRPDGVAVLSFDVAGALPWSAESPTLYPATVELIGEGGTTLDRVEVRVGFRRVRVDGPDLLVNGQRIMVQGVNRHEFDSRTGRTRTRAQVADELSLLKRHGVNAIRTSHYPAGDDFYDLADEYGFYVVDEADLETHAYRTQLASDSRYLAAIVDRVMRTVERNKNRACIIAWSLGNESGTGPNLAAAAAWVRGRDLSRPVLYEGAIALDWHGGQAETDIVAPMYPPLEALSWYASDPRSNRPLVMSEYQHAMGNSNGALADYWRLIRSSPFMQGGFIWELWDHGLDPDGDGRYRFGGDFGEADHDGNFCIDGLLFPDGTPHPAMIELRHVFAPLEISADGDAIVVHNRQSFAGTTRLALHGCVVDASGEAGEFIEIPLPDIEPGQFVALALPETLEAEGSIGVRFEVRTRVPEAWAPAGTVLDATQVTYRPVLPCPPESDEEPQLIGSIAATLGTEVMPREPALSLWRALTDNDKSRFVQPRLEAFAARDEEAAVALGVRHERVISRLADGTVRVDESIVIPDSVIEVPRVGITLGLDALLRHVEWLGDGPHECYADRRDAAMPGRWRSEVDDLHTPYVRPQENGARTETVQIVLTADDGAGVRIRTDRSVQFSVSRYSDETLEQTMHDWELQAEPIVLVHLDIAHRGLGTASVGPDTDPAHRVGPGTYQLTWWIDRVGA